MTDRPILFSAPMVRALLAGSKTQTRRVANFIIEDAPGVFHARNAGGGCAGMTETEVPIHAPDYARFAAGDRLYVREEWCSTPAYDDLKPSDMGGDEPLRYRADDATFNWAEADGALSGRRRAGMHMPRWASRLTLTVTDVRVERLQDISEADARDEGAEAVDFQRDDRLSNAQRIDLAGIMSHRLGYEHLWNTINGRGSWDANPWVVAVSFGVVRANIDQVQA